MSDLERLRIRDAEDWRREAQTLDDAVRRRITQAVFAGKALDDPEEAAIAVGCALGWSARAWIGLLLLPVLIGAAVLAGIPDGTSPWRVLTHAGTIAWFALVVLATFFARARARRAIAANRQVVEEALAGIRPPPPQKGTLSDALNAWRTQTGLQRRSNRR